MKTRIAILLLILSALTLPAHAAKKVFEMGQFQDGSAVYVFGDRVNVRSEPSTNGKVVANLPIGHEVKIIKKTEVSFTTNGLTTNWYEVSFRDSGAAKKGFAWGGFLAVAALPLKGGELVMAGITGFNSNGFPDAQLRLVRGGKLVSSHKFKPIYTPSGGTVFEYSVSASLSGGRGLTGVDNLITLEFEYGACGYNNGSMVFAKKGDKLAGEVQALRVSEAGVFHFSTKLVFPDQKGGAKDRIIALEISESFDEAKQKYVPQGEKKVTYTWDGSKFTSDRKND